MKRIVALLLVIATQSASGQESPTLEEVHKPELRVGFVAMLASRLPVIEDAAAARETATLTGGELFARTQNIAISARSLSGSLGPATSSSGATFVAQEATLVIGAPVFSVEAGIVRRTTSSASVDNRETFWRGGIRSNWDIGGSGVRVILRGAGRFGNAPATKGGNAMQFLGVDADAALLVQAPRHIPMYGMVGWHYERFDDLWVRVGRSEELSGPFFGIGLRWATKPFLQ